MLQQIAPSLSLIRIQPWHESLANFSFLIIVACTSRMRLECYQLLHVRVVHVKRSHQSIPISELPADSSALVNALECIISPSIRAAPSQALQVRLAKTGNTPSEYE